MVLRWPLARAVRRALIQEGHGAGVPSDEIGTEGAVLDEQVRRAMDKWPQVPAVYGWLRLSRRGQWFLIDRSRPDFDQERDGEGSLISSPPIIDFIGRNYECDARGAWYWQNGPQRAFVRLDLAPLVLRVLNEPPTQRLVTHTGYIVERIERVLGDADGNLLMLTDMGPAVVDDRDIGQLQLEVGEVEAGEMMTLATGREAGVADGPLMRLTLERHPAPRGPAWEFRMRPLSGAAALGRELGYLADPTPAKAPEL
jgi:hypothetical protein